MLILNGFGINNKAFKNSSLAYIGYKSLSYSDTTGLLLADN